MRIFMSLPDYFFKSAQAFKCFNSGFRRAEIPTGLGFSGVSHSPCSRISPKSGSSGLCCNYSGSDLLLANAYDLFYKILKTSQHLYDLCTHWCSRAAFSKEAVIGGSLHLITLWDTTPTPLPMLSFSNFTVCESCHFTHLWKMWNYLYQWWQCCPEAFLAGSSSLVTACGTCAGPIPLFVYLYKDI